MYKKFGPDLGDSRGRAEIGAVLCGDESGPDFYIFSARTKNKYWVTPLRFGATACNKITGLEVTGYRSGRCVLTAALSFSRRLVGLLVPQLA